MMKFTVQKNKLPFANVDLHIHVNRNMSKELVIKVLKEASKNNLQSLAFIMHNDVFPYTQASPLMQLIKSGEIAQYYTKQIITGVEIDCIIEGAKNISQNGYDFNGDIVHILMYDFDVNAVTKPGAFYSDEYQQKAFFYDMEVLTKGLQNFGFNFPEGFSFVYGVPYQDQLYKFFMDPKNEKYKADFEKKLGVEDSVFESKSKFARLLTNNKEGVISKILNRNSKQLLNIQDVIKLASTCGGKLVLAHPARMNNNYITEDYIKTIILNYGESFYGIETEYGLDNNSARNQSAFAFLKLKLNTAYNKYKHLKQTGGTEYHTFLNQFIFDNKPQIQEAGKRVAEVSDFFKIIRIPYSSLLFNGIYPQEENTINENC